MLSMQTKTETPKHLLALPFPFYVSGVFGSIYGGELMGRLYEPGFQQKIYRCFRCCTALRWNVGLIGQRACMFSSSSSRIWMCSCTFLYKQAEVGCLFFYLLLSCLIFLYILLNSLFPGCFLTFLLFYFFPSFSYTCIFLSWFSMVYSSDLDIIR